MPLVRLTRRTIDALPLANEGQVLYRDDELNGFGLRVGTTSKVFFAEGQVSARTVRVTLGKYGPVTPEFARKLALQCLCEMAQGIDPNRRKRLEKAKSLTVRQAFDLFFNTKEVQLSPFTVQNCRLSDSLYLAGWANSPIREVTRQMVLKEHRRISTEHGASTANNVFRHLRSVYNFIAASQDDFPPNPVTVLAQARAWNPERRRQTLIAMHSLAAWWRAVMEEQAYVRDFLRMALLTGMRRRELTTLWDNVDLVGRALHLSKTKNGDPFSLPMSNALVEIISARREVAGQTEWVFPGIGKTGHIAETKKQIRDTLDNVKKTLKSLKSFDRIPKNHALNELLKDWHLDRLEKLESVFAYCAASEMPFPDISAITITYELPDGDFPLDGRDRRV